MAIDWGQINTGLQTASPMLLGLSAQLMGRNDQGMMQGVAAMQENAQRAKRKAAIDSLKSEMGLDPTQIALMEAMGPEAAVGWMADEYRTRQGQSALDSFWAAMNGGDTYAPPQAGPAGLDMGPIQTENIEDAEFRQDWLAAMEGAPGVEKFHAIPDRLMADLQRDLGLTQAQAAGVVGNLATETGNFQHMQEINPVVKGSRGGFGYAQWTGPRRRQYEAWAQENGLDPTSYEANYGFLVHELTATPESRVMGDLTAAETPEQAAQVFSEQFLRPGIPHMDRRKANAARYAGVASGGQTGGQKTNRTEQALRALLSNPNVPEAQKQYAIAEYQRRFGRAEPVEGKIVGNNLVNPYTGEVIYEGVGDEDLPSAVQEYEYAKAQGFPGSFLEFTQAKKGQGFEFVGPDGTTMRFGGGAGAGKPLTVEQGKNAGFLVRAQSAEAVLQRLESEGTNLGNALAAKIPLAGNYMVSPEYQLYEQAQRNFINAQLRRESGAVISEEEFDNARKQYFPQPGDSAAVIAQKRQNRMDAIKGFEIGAGPGAESAGKDNANNDPVGIR